MMPASAAAVTLAALSSLATTLAPPAISAFAVATPEAPRPKTATDFPANVVMRIMGKSNANTREFSAAQRSFSVASPTSASTTEMIQKRTTTVNSCQPCCS